MIWYNTQLHENELVLCTVVKNDMTPCTVTKKIWYHVLLEDNHLAPCTMAKKDLHCGKNEELCHHALQQKIIFFS